MLEQVEPLGRVILGALEGNLHDIGKNLAGMMLERAGSEVIDLGVDVTSAQSLEAVRRYQPHFLGMSTLLTTTIPATERMTVALRETGRGDTVWVMVGGAPLTEDYANCIGADVYAPGAAKAAQQAKELSNRLRGGSG